jgi:hypothetical protein
MPGRNGDPTLGIQRESATALKHHFYPTFLHKILLFPTLRECASQVKRWVAFFSITTSTYTGKVEYFEEIPEQNSQTNQEIG